MDRLFWFTYLLFIGFLLTVLAACGGGGGDNGSGAGAAAGGTQPAPLAGAWFGAVEDPTGQLHSFRLTIADGTITAMTVDGVQVEVSGELSHDDAQIYSATLTVFGHPLTLTLFSDPSATHFVYLDNFFEFGVLQKGATALPAYSSIDINNTWRGVSVFTDFNEFTWDPSSAICIVGECSVTEVDDRMREKFTGGFDSVYGRWLGTTTITLPNHPDVSKVSRAFVSPDKKFMGVWRCLVGADGSLLFPGKCTYSAWSRT